METPTEEERRAFKIGKVKVGDDHRISLSTMKVSEVERGDVFYLEEPTGELVLDDDGKFLLVATYDAQMDKNTGFWGVQVEGIA